MPQTSDGSVFSADGRLLFCSVDRFVSDICEGNCCLICGRAEREVPFNREHILPNWLLHQFNLHSATMTLPNQELHGYGTYTLPCCVECNDRLGRTFETPISEAFASGFASVQTLIEREGDERLFQWLALIFLKLQLKDRLLRKHLDRRLGNAPISETYEWPYFHHVHTLVRAHYTGASLGDYLVGSIVLMKLEPDPTGEAFDMASITDACTIYLRAGDLALFAVLNDGGACARAITPLLDRVDGTMNSLQAREIAAELAAAKLHLENPPVFRTEMSDRDGSDLRIVAEVEPGGPRFLNRDESRIGFLKHFMFRHALDRIVGKSREECVALLQKNELSFLFDTNGRFLSTVGRMSETSGGDGARTD